MPRSNTGPSDATITVNVDADMMLYDQLPPVVRRALQDARFNYGADDIRLALGHYPVDRIAASIPHCDRIIALENPPA